MSARPNDQHKMTHNKHSKLENFHLPHFPNQQTSCVLKINLWWLIMNSEKLTLVAGGTNRCCCCCCCCCFPFLPPSTWQFLFFCFRFTFTCRSPRVRLWEIWVGLFQTLRQDETWSFLLIPPSCRKRFHWNDLGPKSFF